VRAGNDTLERKEQYAACFSSIQKLTCVNCGVNDEYELDFAPLIVEENPGEVFLALKDKERFRFVQGNYALIGPSPETAAYDEKIIDIAPECVRFFCENYGKKLKAPESVL
jgi:hypothetical protein